MWILAILGILIGLPGAIIALMQFKDNRINNLWTDLCSYANEHVLVDRHMLEIKSLDNIIRFCNSNINYNRKMPEAMKLKICEFKRRAERLNKWWAF